MSSESLVFVTGLYAVRDGYIPQLLTEFQRLLSLLPPTARLFVWTDLSSLPTFAHPGVRILQAPLRSFETYATLTSLSLPLHLPASRNLHKDTAPFMALMNAKLEMLWRVVPYVPSDAVLAWIDCGIAKIFTDTAAIAAAFERLRVPPALGVCVAPGCWPVGPVSKEAVCWRFCGGFFLMGTHFLNTVFYPRFRRVLEESYIQQGRSAWEVNVLADVEREAPSLFQWFAADHNDSMIVGMVGAVGAAGTAATAATAATSFRP